MEWNDLTGTDDFFKQIDQFAIYPNPVTDWLVLPHESISESEIRISDLNGNLVWSDKKCGNDPGIDISQLAPGIYFIWFLNNDHTVRSSRFVKK